MRQERYRDYPPSPRRRPRRKRRRRSPLLLAWRFGLLSLLLAALCSTALLTYWMIKSPPLRQAAAITVTGGLSTSNAFPGRDGYTVLFLGRDEDRDNRGRVMDTRGRTDAILLAHFDFTGRHVNLLSIPRDTLVRIPGHRGQHKINAANQYGGPDLTVRTIDNLIGIRADAYVLVDYDMFARMVDLVGGIPVEVDKKLEYDDNWGNLHIHLEPGFQVLNGEQALGLVRYRKSNDGHADSDQERIDRQHRFITGVRKQISKPRNLIRVPEIADVCLQELDTNLALQESLALANFARSAGKKSIRMEILPSVPTRTALRVDMDKARPLLDEMFLDTPVTADPAI